MEGNEIFSQLKDIALDVMGDKAAQIDVSSLFDDMQADSIDLLQLITSVEEKFGIAIPDEELANLTSVSDVIDLVNKLKG